VAPCTNALAALAVLTGCWSEAVAATQGQPEHNTGVWTVACATSCDHSQPKCSPKPQQVQQTKGAATAKSKRRRLPTCGDCECREAEGQRKQSAGQAATNGYGVAPCESNMTVNACMDTQQHNKLCWRRMCTEPRPFLTPSLASGWLGAAPTVV
jgi:hypothetical protein